jgi:NTE family protein
MNTHPFSRFHKHIALILATLMWAYAVHSQTGKGRPKIGVSLSGGGAKGLAHIGILKAMDSAGLQPDYITGTSMGSIVGGLYAIGYSGSDIETIAEKIDWNLLLSNESELRGIIMEEKSEYKRYAVELPFRNGKFQLPTGMVESEELWLTLSELFFPVYNIKSFDKFSIPFKCIATDATNGEGVVLDKGEITTALRASMAIPSFFTAVDLNGRRLVDGGIVRNFPVSDVRKMGAEIVIGVNVSTGLNPKEKLNNPLSVLSNIIFFKEAENTLKQIELCDIYVPVTANDFNTASFGRSREIIDSGMLIGNMLYPRFKALVDSLDRIYGKQTLQPERLPKVDSILITGFEVRGLKHTEEKFFLDMMGFRKDTYYTPREISRRIRKGFGIRYYNRITYRLQETGQGSANLVFQVEENPLSAAKFSLHYNSFSGISLVMNFTSRNLFSKSSRTYGTLNLGENIRLRAEHLEYLGKRRNFSAVGTLQYEFLDFNHYSDFDEFGSFRQHYFRVGGEFGYSFDRSNATGLGLRYESLRYDPSLIAILDVKGKNSLVTGSAFYRINTLNRNVYPSRGWKLDYAAEWVMSQRGELTLYKEGQPILNADSLGISYDPYGRTTLLLDYYRAAGKKGVLLGGLQGGMNFNYNQYLTNDFIVGGLTRQFRNQVVFAGYPENTIFTNSVAALQLGYQYELFEKLFLTWRSNAMIYNYIPRKNFDADTKFLSGHALTAGYLTAIGPVELSVMYGDQAGKLRAYVNIGLHF